MHKLCRPSIASRSFAGRVAVVLVLALGTVLPSVAHARRPPVIAPPGDSAIGQYVEDVPTDRGPTPTQPARGGFGVTLPAALAGRATRRAGVSSRARRAGVSSRAPATAVAVRAQTRHTGSRARLRPRRGATRPASPSGVTTASSHRPPPPSVMLAPAALRSSGNLLASAAWGQNGLGVLVPLLLLASLLGAVMVRVRGGRRGP